MDKGHKENKNLNSIKPHKWKQNCELFSWKGNLKTKEENDAKKEKYWFMYGVLLYLKLPLLGI